MDLKNIIALSHLNSDYTTSLPVVYDDGGRAAAGFKGMAGDCVCRSIAIATGRPYLEVYQALSKGAGSERNTKGASARNGIHIWQRWFKEYVRSVGLVWTPTMKIGSGCTVHLLQGELPSGRLVVRVSKHLTAVIDGVIHDTDDPQRTTIWHGEDGLPNRLSHRCVYGYWTYSGEV